MISDTHYDYWDTNYDNSWLWIARQNHTQIRTNTTMYSLPAKLITQYHCSWNCHLYNPVDTGCKTTLMVYNWQLSVFACVHSLTEELRTFFDCLTNDIHRTFISSRLPGEFSNVFPIRQHADNIILLKILVLFTCIQLLISKSIDTVKLLLRCLRLSQRCCWKLKSSCNTSCPSQSSSLDHPNNIWWRV